MGRRDQPLTPDAGRSTGAGEGNQNAATFGHRSAEIALSKDKPFSGLALAKETEIRKRWLNDGVLSLVEDNTVRMQTVFELFEAVVMAKLDPDDTEAVEHTFDKFIKWGSKINNELMRLHELAQARDAVTLEGFLSQEANRGDAE